MPVSKSQPLRRPAEYHPSAVSSVLDSALPQFTADEAARIAADLFGFRGTASSLGSERDQAFLLDDGGRGGVLKISNPSEDEVVLDFEEAAIAHVAACEYTPPFSRRPGA